MLNGVCKCSRTYKKNIHNQSYLQLALNPTKRLKMHLSSSQSPVLVDGATDTPHNHGTPKVGNDRKCNDEENDILGVLQEVLSSEDEVIEHVHGYQDGKVECWELAC